MLNSSVRYGDISLNSLLFITLYCFVRWSGDRCIPLPLVAGSWTSVVNAALYPTGFVCYHCMVACCMSSLPADHNGNRHGVVLVLDSASPSSSNHSANAPKMSKNNTFPRSQHSLKAGRELEDIRHLCRRPAVRRTSRPVTRTGQPSAFAQNFAVPISGFTRSEEGTIERFE